MNDKDKVHTFRIGLLSSIGTITMLLFTEVMLEIMVKLSLFPDILNDEFAYNIIILGLFIFLFIIGVKIFGYDKKGF